uniref:Calponin-homology (CH) domain-containing protein n=1 Tax=Paramoeba aestuarina TaxID=180227 RepID=A0A7S4KNC9_9EUKA|mmetsp:Transcript_21786/g.33855  ORF Transcript_21786/g.33855 Transcript_21786/m.33855 type:complete len:143 (+) Transcript_21786:72-500(+)
MASLGKVLDWVALESKVFTRWINQKFISAKRPERIENVLAGFGDGKVFGAFLEALSETSMEGTKWNKGKMRKLLRLSIPRKPQTSTLPTLKDKPITKPNLRGKFTWITCARTLLFGQLLLPMAFPRKGCCQQGTRIQRGSIG